MDEMRLLLDTDSDQAVLDWLQKSVQGVSVVKGGTGTTYLVEPSQVTEITYAHSDHVVDTVGAGDGFCAGFISGLLRALPLEQAVRLGNLVGSLVVRAQGDWEALPTWEQVQIEQHAANHIER